MQKPMGLSAQCYDSPVINIAVVKLEATVGVCPKQLRLCHA